MIVRTLNPSVSKPSPLAKTPTETCWYQDEGKASPTIFAEPESVETGERRPEKLTAGTTYRIEVMKIAATWVLTKDEMSWPKPVVANT